MQVIARGGVTSRQSGPSMRLKAEGDAHTVVTQKYK